MTKRYARLGGKVDQIYPGTLEGLRTALADATRLGGTQRVWLHEPPAETTLIRVIENGKVTRTPPRKKQEGG